MNTLKQFNAINTFKKLLLYIEISLLVILAGVFLFDYSQIKINNTLNNCPEIKPRYYSTTLFGVLFELPVINVITNSGPTYFCKINPETDASDFQRLAVQIINTFFVSTFFAGVLTVLFWNISIPDTKQKRLVRYSVIGTIILITLFYNLAVISGLIYNTSKM